MDVHGYLVLRPVGRTTATQPQVTMIKWDHETEQSYWGSPVSNPNAGTLEYPKVAWEPERLLGVWIDNPSFYVSIVDGDRFNVILGPFQTEKECREWAYIETTDGGNRDKHLRMINLANELDPKSVFYGFGMVKMANGYRTGVLNDKLGINR